jgi:hypothetical protein
MDWEALLNWLRGPEGACLRYGLAGALGAVVNCALEEEPVVLPRLRGNRLELGFLGNLATCFVTAQIADHSFTTAFLAALAGTMILRTLKRRIEAAFAEELERLKRGEE